MEASWKYIGLTKDRLAMYMCTSCSKVFVQQSPTREPPTETECPSCHAKMNMAFGGTIMCKNCYTCRYGHQECEIMESMNEDSRREDSVCHSWGWPVDYSLKPCPFCGNPAEIADVKPYEWCPGEAVRAIRCSDQFCPGHKAECRFMVSSKNDYKDARRLWNFRKKKNRVTWRWAEQ